MGISVGTKLEKKTFPAIDRKLLHILFLKFIICKINLKFSIQKIREKKISSFLIF